MRSAPNFLNYASKSKINRANNSGLSESPCRAPFMISISLVCMLFRKTVIVALLCIFGRVITIFTLTPDMCRLFHNFFVLDNIKGTLEVHKSSINVFSLEH